MFKKFKGQKVFVLGDTIVDPYIQTEFIGSNAKTPTHSVRYIDTKNYVGGAGIVAKHLKSAGADVTFCSLSVMINYLICKRLKKSWN